MERLRTACALIILVLSACGTIKQVDLKTGVGNELRDHDGEPSDHRFSAHAGPEVSFDNGFKTGLIYRHRITDFDPNSLEHGVFLNASIPLWKKK